MSTRVIEHPSNNGGAIIFTITATQISIQWSDPFQSLTTPLRPAMARILRDVLRNGGIEMAGSGFLRVLRSQGLILTLVRNGKAIPVFLTYDDAELDAIAQTIHDEARALFGTLADEEPVPDPSDPFIRKLLKRRAALIENQIHWTTHNDAATQEIAAIDVELDAAGIIV
jgi:hypothetical protein